MDTDGLCGCSEPGLDGLIVCTLRPGHAGDHSWRHKKEGLRIFGGITVEEVKERAAAGSPAAQAMLKALPDDNRSGS